MGSGIEFLVKELVLLSGTDVASTVARWTVDWPLEILTPFVSVTVDFFGSCVDILDIAV